MAERQFGPYRLVQQLAVGGMAEIHLAKTHGIAGFEKYVALKMIHPNYSLDQQFIQMLIDEAKITVQLQHVNIAQTFDLGRVGETYYITIEYVDGADLYKLLRRSAELDRAIPIAVACYMGKEVASGLDYAHRKRDHAGRALAIVHRDVSPQNVLISYAGEVKLVDFGIAKATSRARQTAVGVIKGKYYYMSPEQAWGEALDHRTDIFSTGILLYETLTGQMLYLEEDLHRLLEMVRRADIPPPSTIRKDIPPPLERIVMRALAKRPDDRYQNAGDLANDLERFLHAHAPIFTAAKVASWLGEVLGGAAAPTLLGPDEKEKEKEKERAKEKEKERGRNETRRFTREQLVQARSEFSDENSIIFGITGSRSRGTDTGTDARAERQALDETSTYDSPVPDVDALPGAPGVPTRAPTALTEPITGKMTPVRQPPSSPPESPAARLARPPTSPPLPLPPSGDAGRSPAKRPPTARGADEATRPLVDASQLAAVAASLPKRAPAIPLAGSPLQRDASSRGATPWATPDPSGDPDETPLPTPALGRGPRHDDHSDGGEEIGGDETLISEPPGFGGPDHTDVTAWATGGGAGGEFSGDETVVQPTHLPDDDHEAPTLLKAQAAPGTGTAWENAPALLAKVPQPAVSELRPPRQSRRTPAGGVNVDAPTQQSDVLNALLHPGSSGVPQIALSPVSPTLSHPLAHPGPFPPGMHGMPGPPPPTPFPFPGAPGHGAPFTTRQIQASLDVDEIPDKYKIRRRAQVNPFWIAAGALVLAAVVAAVLIAIYADTEEPARGQTALIEVVSSPSGAVVTVDGEELPESTPTSFQGHAGRTYLIRLDLPRHQRWEREHPVTDESQQKVVARLNPILVKLWVESKPPGAEVFIGGTSVGRTPVVLPGLDPQTTRSIELRLKGYRPERRPLDWSQETEKRLTLELEP